MTTNRFFPVKLDIRIDWSELDYFGHVNNVSFFKYIQASRVNYWDAIGLTQSHKDTNIGPVLASCKCDFKLPLYYPGQISVFASVEFIKNTSWSICHKMINEKEDVVAEAQDVMVMFDFNQNIKIACPENLRKTIEELENRQF